MGVPSKSNVAVKHRHIGVGVGQRGEKLTPLATLLPGCILYNLSGTAALVPALEVTVV